MKEYYFLTFIIVSILINVNHLNAGRLTDEQIEEAKALPRSSATFESYFHKEEEDNIKPDWFTIEEVIFEYTDKGFPLIMANSFMSSSVWGEIVAYPPKTNLNTITLFVPGSFSVTGASFIAALDYQYVPAEEQMSPHFIIREPKIKGQPNETLCCLHYFLNEFVTNRTAVPIVFCDLKTQKRPELFTIMGFKKGTPLGYTKYAQMGEPSYWENPQRHASSLSLSLDNIPQATEDFL